MSPADLVQRARDLVPTVRGRAVETERLRRLPDATIDDFRAAGFFRTLAPRRYGGAQLELADLADCVLEIGRGCGSSAWCLCILGVHNWLGALFGEQAQDELFAGNDHVLFAGTFSGAGEAVPVDGGFRVNGRWAFASAVDFGSWVAVAPRVRKDDTPGPPDLRMMLLPIGDVEIVDTWFVAGLRGTGSKDVVVRDAFIPAHRALAFRDIAVGAAPGVALHPDAPIYRLPLYSALTMIATAPALGIALGAVDDYVALTRDRIPYAGGSKYAEQAPVHVRMGRAAAMIDCARMLHRRGLEDASRLAAAGLPLDVRMRIRRDCAFAVGLCIDAVDLLVAAAGAKAQYDHSPLQRAQRDLHTLRTHVVFDFDAAMELFGRSMLGLPPNSVFF